jgi:hypothetical protein
VAGGSDRATKSSVPFSAAAAQQRIGVTLLQQARRRALPVERRRTSPPLLPRSARASRAGATLLRSASTTCFSAHTCEEHPNRASTLRYKYTRNPTVYPAESARTSTHHNI